MMHVYVDETLLTYITTFVGTTKGTPLFNAAFDTDADDKLTMDDVMWFVSRNNTYQELYVARLFVTPDLVSWVNTNYLNSQAGDSRYTAELDLDKNGVIDAPDVLALSARQGTWIEFFPPSISIPIWIWPIVILSVGIAGIGIYYLMKRSPKKEMT